MMIRHCVLLKFLPETDEKSRKAAIDGIKELPDFIPEIVKYSVGFDANLQDDNFDLAVVGDFETEEDYLVYASHPKHQTAISNLLAPFMAERSAVQYLL